MSDQFTPKDAIGEAVARVLAVLRQHKRGDVVAWRAVETVAGFKRGETHWTAFRSRLGRDFRRETGVVVWPVAGVGIKLLTVPETLEFRARKRRLRAFRQMRRDEQELLALPNNILTTQQKILKAGQIAAAREGKRAVLRQLRVGARLARPTPVNPVPSNQRRGTVIT